MDVVAENELKRQAHPGYRRDVNEIGHTDQLTGVCSYSVQLVAQRSADAWVFTTTLVT